MGADSDTPDPICDPPSPSEVAETERLAGETLKGNPHEARLRDTASWYERWPRTAFVRADMEAITWALAELDALRAKASDLSLALAREAQRRQEAERERDQLGRLSDIPHLPAWSFADVKGAFVKGYDVGFEAVRKAAGLDP